MDRMKKTSAVVAIIGIVLFSVIISFAGIVSAEQMTPEELFENLSGGWAFNGTMTVGEKIAGGNPDNYPLVEPNEDYEQIGILVMAHGSPSDSWCDPVRAAVQNVSSPYPVELGFLEFVPNETINVAVDKLDEAGVTKIIAVPLFISSSSGHIAELEYVLGLRTELSEMSMLSTTRQEPVTNVISTMQTSVEGVELERFVISREGRFFVSYMPISVGISITQHGGGTEEEEELVPVDTTAEIVLTNAIQVVSVIF